MPPMYLLYHTLQLYYIYGGLVNTQIDISFSISIIFSIITLVFWGKLCYNSAMDIIVKKFEELDVSELYEIMQARAEVFVVEQECAYQDLDGVDKEAYHVYLRENGELVAYLRVLDKGKRLDEVSVGRVISLKRGLGLGKRLMRAGLQVAKEKFGATIVKVGAQVQAKGFYESVGFRQVSGEYDEDGIPHIYMIYEENSGAGTR